MSIGGRDDRSRTRSDTIENRNKGQKMTTTTIPKPKALQFADRQEMCATAWIEGSEPHQFRIDTAAELRRQHAEIARLTAENEALRVKMELVDYVLQDDIYNRLTPRVVDIAYSAFVSGRDGRNEAGEPCDWFNDTKPRVVVWLDKIKKDLTEEAAHGIGEKP